MPDAAGRRRARCSPQRGRGVSTIRSDDIKRQRGTRGMVSPFIWLIALLPLVLLVATLIGLGLTRGLPGPLSLICSLVLATLPTIGLATMIGGGRRLRVAIGGWLWSLALLSALPLYFPGERAAATASGLRWLTALSGETAARAVGEAGAGLVVHLGRDPAPSIPTAITTATPTDVTASVTPSERPSPRSKRPEYSDGELLVTLPYEGDERSLRIKVDIDGPRLGEQLELIFDTGATITTLDEQTVRSLGVDLPANAPRVTLQTANGRIEAPLVLVDAIWLGAEPVEWVTIAVCDSCASPPAAGLLGLNVSRQFHVSLDYDRKRIELRGRRSVRDRQLDISQWLEIRSQARRSWNGLVEIDVTGRNLARQEIDKAVVEVDCDGEAFAVQLDNIPARGERETAFSLPRGTDCKQLRVSLARAQWRLDRF